jgi:ketosteroid isomerase-like protein
MTSAPHESPNVAAALALPRALERGVHGEALRPLYTPDATSIEHPNPIAPYGATHDVDHIVAASDAGAALMQSQRYDISDVVEAGDLVIFRYTWTGIVGVDRGPFRIGQQIVAQIAAFATIADGRIARFETYDCYEPFDGRSE